MGAALRTWRQQRAAVPYLERPAPGRVSSAFRPPQSTADVLEQQRKHDDLVNHFEAVLDRAQIVVHTMTTKPSSLPRVKVSDVGPRLEARSLLGLLTHDSRTKLLSNESLMSSAAQLHGIDARVLHCIVTSCAAPAVWERAPNALVATWSPPSNLDIRYEYLGCILEQREQAVRKEALSRERSEDAVTVMRSNAAQVTAPRVLRKQLANRLAESLQKRDARRFPIDESS